MLVTFFFMLGLAAIARPLIILLIGEKWLTAVKYLQIICFAGMLFPLHAINLNILQVKGRSDLFLRLEVIKKTLAVLPIILGIFWGIEFMLLGSVFTSFVSFFLNSYYSGRLIQYSTRQQIYDILPIFLISFLVSSIMYIITFLNFSNTLTILIQCIIGFLLYIGIYERINLSCSS